MSLSPMVSASEVAGRSSAGMKNGLFWRTFVLLAFLIAASMAAWVASFRIVERTPRGEQIAAQVVSIVTITRAALLHSAPALRRELLFELATTQGIRVYPREEDDDTEPMPDTELIRVIEDSVRARLGEDTHFAGYVNDIRGFWVSFRIDDDDYWLMLDRERVERASGVQWIGWATMTLLLSLVGAAFISRLINQPLSRLSSAARSMARGMTPPPLPDSGPAEIREANQSFNQMVHDLKQVESDRALILAGISHDLRTPIARMLLEVEMAGLSEEARKGMQSDLAQMEAIIAQFLDYARPAEPASFTEIDVSETQKKIAEESSRHTDLRLQAHIADGLRVRCNPTELQRVVINLIENARRYGKTNDSLIAEVDLTARMDGGQVMFEVADRGTGLPENQIENVLRPFTRLDTARSQANGAGLGLAIVDRVVQRHRGRLEIKNREGGGLAVRVWLGAV